MNIAVIGGNLSKDAELRTTQSGKAVCTFTVAVRRDKEITDFIPVVVWNRGEYKLADYCGSLKKGKRVTVHGKIQTRSYETQSGDKRYVTEIIADGVEWENERRPEEKKKDFEPLDDDQCPF